MQLTQSYQAKAARFGGKVAPIIPTNDPYFDPEAFLNMLNKDDYQSTFAHWITQCWIYDDWNSVPRSNEQLAGFDLYSLLPEFKKRFINGDWRRIILGCGATLDEMGLQYQMKARQELCMILNKDRPLRGGLPEAVSFYQMPQIVQVPIFLEFINLLTLHGYDGITPGFVTDGHAFHVFTPISFNHKRQTFRYIDDTGENETHMFDAQNNALGIQADFIGYTKGHRTWEITLEEFEQVFVGLPLFSSMTNLWNSTARLGVWRWDDYFKKRFTPEHPLYEEFQKDVYKK